MNTPHTPHFNEDQELKEALLNNFFTPNNSYIIDTPTIYNLLLVIGFLIISILTYVYYKRKVYLMENPHLVKQKKEKNPLENHIPKAITQNNQDLSIKNKINISNAEKELINKKNNKKLSIIDEAPPKREIQEEVFIVNKGKIKTMKAEWNTLFIVLALSNVFTLKYAYSVIQENKPHQIEITNNETALFISSFGNPLEIYKSNISDISLRILRTDEERKGKPKLNPFAKEYKYCELTLNFIEKPEISHTFKNNTYNSIVNIKEKEGLFAQCLTGEI